MASGQEHEKFTKRFFIPFGMIVGLILGIPSGLLAGIGFLIGGIWLSPDLDTSSRPYQRWGPLKPLWWPYRKLIPHRSILSHGPIIGTAIKLLYLIFTLICLLSILKFFGGPSPDLITGFFYNLITKHPKQSSSFILGLEASLWLHLIQDGDPLPFKWKRSK